jgi:hypothetical protein
VKKALVAVIAVLVLCAGIICLIRCGKPKSKPGPPQARLGFITSPGKHVILPGDSFVAITEKEEGLVFSIQMGAFGVAPAKVISPQKNWFFYAETPRRIWLHDGEKDLTLYFAKPKLSSSRWLARHGAALWRETPKEVRARVSHLKPAGAGEESSAPASGVTKPEKN